MKISFVLDRGTAFCFKAAGVRAVYLVDDVDQARERVSELLKDQEMLAILVVDHLFNQMIDLAERTEKKTYPLVMAISGTGKAVAVKTDPLADLIRRKVGIEVRW